MVKDPRQKGPAVLTFQRRQGTGKMGWSSSSAVVDAVGGLSCLSPGAEMSLLVQIHLCARARV